MTTDPVPMTCSYGAFMACAVGFDEVRGCYVAASEIVVTSIQAGADRTVFGNVVVRGYADVGELYMASPVLDEALRKWDEDHPAAPPAPLLIPDESEAMNDRVALVAAVLADPDALWAALSSGVRIASPWLPDGDLGTKLRVDHTRTYEFAEVSPSSYGYRAVVPFLALAITIERRGRLDREVQAEAMEWCDTRLREAGILLANGNG